MILPDFLLRWWARRGGVTPYNPAMVNPMSVDLTFSGRVCYPRPNTTPFRWWPNKPPSSDYWTPAIETPSIIMQPGAFVLVDTAEFLRFPPFLCGMLMLKSSSGRAGLEHHHAGWFDPGFSGTATLEITNTAPYPIEILSGQPIVQMVVMLCVPPARDYRRTGQYGGQRKPTTAGGNR